MGRISHQEEFGCRGERLKTQTPQGSLILLIGSKIELVAKYRGKMFDFCFIAESIQTSAV